MRSAPVAAAGSAGDAAASATAAVDRAARRARRERFAGMTLASARRGHAQTPGRGHAQTPRRGHAHTLEKGTLVGLSPEDLVVERGRLGHHAADGEPLLCSSAPLGTELAGQFGIVEKAPERGSERLGAARLDHEAGPSVLDYLLHSPEPGDDNRYSRRHRLEQREWHPFVVAREHKAVRLCEHL